MIKEMLPYVQIFNCLVCGIYSRASCTPLRRGLVCIATVRVVFTPLRWSHSIPLLSFLPLLFLLFLFFFRFFSFSSSFFFSFFFFLFFIFLLSFLLSSFFFSLFLLLLHLLLFSFSSYPLSFSLSLSFHFFSKPVTPTLQEYFLALSFFIPSSPFSPTPPSLCYSLKYIFCTLLFTSDIRSCHFGTGRAPHPLPSHRTSGRFVV